MIPFNYINEAHLLGRKERVHEKRQELNEELSFLDRQLVKQCTACIGVGVVAHDDLDYDEDWSFNDDDKFIIEECYNCEGYGVVCYYCHTCEDNCDCGNFVEENQHKYVYSVMET